MVLLYIDKQNYNIVDVPYDFTYHQSQKQSFYYFKEVLINNQSITDEDWIISYHDDVIVGARKWFGPYTDVPAMGYDGFDETIGYCEENSIVTFKVYQASTNKLIDMSSDKGATARIQAEVCTIASPSDINGGLNKR